MIYVTNTSNNAGVAIYGDFNIAVCNYGAINREGTGMNEKDNEIVSSRGEFLFYQTQDGKTRVECRFEDETLWLSQGLMAELYQKDVRTISEHLKNIYTEGELSPEATIRKFRIVRLEGEREVARDLPC